MKHKFPVIYWSNNSTKVQFQAFTTIPKDVQITSCMVFAKKGNSVLLSRPKRGWGLPGGHKEIWESPEDCAIREVLEETNTRIENLKLIGGWRAQKVRHNAANSKYPEVAYQLLFLADVAQIGKFTSEYEATKRKFVKYSEIRKYHHEYERFSEILAYTLDCIGSEND